MITRKRIKEKVNSTFKNYARQSRLQRRSALRFFDHKTLNEHKVGMKHIASKVAILNRSTKLGFSQSLIKPIKSLGTN